MQIGRKNVHGKGGVRFKTPYTSSKKKAQVRNLVTELVLFEKVTVTSPLPKTKSKLLALFIINNFNNFI